MKALRKINWIIAVLLLAAVLAAVAVDLRVSMQAESFVEELEQQNNGNLEKKSEKLINTWHKLVKNRYITAGFMGLVFVIICVLVLLVGPAKEASRHIGIKEAEHFVADIEREYQEKQMYVEPSETKADRTALEELLITSLDMPKLREVRLENEGVVVSWDAVRHAQGYSVWRKTEDGKWKKIGKERNGGTSYTDYNIASETLYVYTVKAYAFIGGKRIASSKDPLGKHIYVEKGNVPGIPVVSVETNEEGKLCVVWDDVENAQVYRVYRREPGDEWVKIDKVPAGKACCYVDESARAGRLYEYTICAGRFIHKKLVSGAYNPEGVQIQY